MMRGLLLLALAVVAIALAEVPQGDIVQAREDVQEITRVLHRFAHVEDRSWGVQVSSLLNDLQARLADHESRPSVETKAPVVANAQTMRSESAMPRSKTGDTKPAMKATVPADFHQNSHAKRGSGLAERPRKNHAKSTHANKHPSDHRGASGISAKKSKTSGVKAHANKAPKHLAPKQRNTVTEQLQAKKGDATEWDLEQDIDQRIPQERGVEGTASTFDETHGLSLSKRTRDRRASEVLGDIKKDVRGLMKDMQRIDLDKATMDTYVMSHPGVVIGTDGPH